MKDTMYYRFESIQMSPSTNVRNIWFHPDLDICAVEFHNKKAKDDPSLRGDVYVYKNVPTHYKELFIREAERGVLGSMGTLARKLLFNNPMHPYTRPPLIEAMEVDDAGWSNINTYLAENNGTLQRLKVFLNNDNND